MTSSGSVPAVVASAATVGPVTTLWGVRCSDPLHRHAVGQIHAVSSSEERMRSLAKGNPCNELVVSGDGGRTWARAE